MTKRIQILNAVRIFGGITLIAGIILFCIGFFGSGSSPLTPIGIGTIMGAVFIFLMGVFFTVTEEMLERSGKA